MTMDLFEVLQPYNLLLCRRCGYFINPAALATHLRNKHASHADVRTRDRTGGAASIARRLQAKFPDIVDPARHQILPGLALHRGEKCSRCIHIIRTTPNVQSRMSAHFQEHRAVRKKRGGRHDAIQDFVEDGIPISTAVYRQRFFSRGLQCWLFQVTPQQDAEPRAGLLAEREETRRLALSREALLHELVSTELDDNRKMLDASAEVCRPIATDTEVDPWMEHTEWRQVFNGILLLKAARLAHMPNPSTEPHLQVLTESLDRLVEAAYAAVCDDRIGVFDRFRINSFVNDDSRRASERQLVVNLRKDTYRV